MKPRAYPNFRLPQRMGLGISTLGNGFELLPEVTEGDFSVDLDSNGASGLAGALRSLARLPHFELGGHGLLCAPLAINNNEHAEVKTKSNNCCVLSDYKWF